MLTKSVFGANPAPATPFVKPVFIPPNPAEAAQQNPGTNREAVETCPDLNNSNTPSQKATVQKVDIGKQIQVFKQECVKIPSVPFTYIKHRQRLSDQERQGKKMSGNTRRQMTEERITQNILKFNRPAEVSAFHDIFVAHSAHIVSLQRSLMSETVRTHDAGNQTFNIYKKDAQIGQSGMGLMSSQLSRLEARPFKPVPAYDHDL